MSDTQILNPGFDPNSYVPGQPVTVAIEVIPDLLTVAYAMEDTPPGGWSVSNINEGGEWDSVNKKVKWGPFFDNQQRTFTYQAAAPSDESGTKEFHGVFSANGINFNIDREISKAFTSEEMNISQGWSMISLPLMPENASLSLLFPDAVVVYGYEKGIGYKRVTSGEELRHGDGYWILLDQNQTYNLTGQPIQSYTLPVSEDGWAMIGGCTSDAQSTTDNCSISVIYRYVKEAGYQRVLGTQNLKPGIGYWILFDDVMDQAKLTIEAIDSKI